MTARTGATSVDGTPISQTDLARIEAEERLHDEHQRGAVKVVAAAALDVNDCRTLLAMLGIEAAVAAARAELGRSKTATAGRRRRSAA